MAEAVLVFAGPFQKVQLHRRAAKLDAETPEAVNPPPHREPERHVRVEASDHVTGGKEAEIPGCGGVFPVLPAKLGERAGVGCDPSA